MIVIKTRHPDAELEQKILALLKQENIDAEQISTTAADRIVLPGLMIDEAKREVSCGNKKTSLTRLEFDLLMVLASGEGRMLSKEELFRAVWGADCADTMKVVANTVSNLRKKLAECGHENDIRTLPGGYSIAKECTT